MFLYKCFIEIRLLTDLYEDNVKAIIDFLTKQKQKKIHRLRADFTLEI